MIPRHHLRLTELGISEMELQDLNFKYKYKYKASQVVLEITMPEDHSTGDLRDMHKIQQKKKSVEGLSFRDIEKERGKLRSPT